jgi:hypothetical protein
MQTIVVNYYAIVVGAVTSMIIGAIWYGPLFGKKWTEIIGVDKLSEQEKKKMEAQSKLVYSVQFLLTLFQVLILAHLIADTQRVGGLERALWLYAGFVVPTLATAIMWTGESTKRKWERFLIQAGYQLVIFLVFGLLLQFWK